MFVIKGILGLIIIALPLLGCFWLVKRLFLGKPEDAPPGCPCQHLPMGDGYRAPKDDMTLFWD